MTPIWAAKHADLLSRMKRKNSQACYLYTLSLLARLFTLWKCWCFFYFLWKCRRLFSSPKWGYGPMSKFAHCIATSPHLPLWSHHVPHGRVRNGYRKHRESGEGGVRAHRVGVPTPKSDLSCLRFLWACLHPGSQEKASHRYLCILVIHCTVVFFPSQDRDPRDDPAAVFQLLAALQENGPTLPET